MRRFAATLAITASLALSGCISFGPDVPDNLLTLTPTAVAPAGAGTVGTAAQAIEIGELEAPAKLSVTRVPVQVDATKVAYLKDAVWVERPVHLFRGLVAETIRTRSGRVVVDGDSSGISPESIVTGTLREFGYDAPTSSVVVRFDAVRQGGPGAVQTRRFETRVTGVLPEAGPVGEALNVAANDIAEQVADWVG
ncbi:hypothetical protein HME9302_00452 [Alteripontixanthobacter maritimus]|uniref:ABC-type transport auxiliary lipoprotein component domain-containing protein n=1 Tax=Alteripontixanthobacter maritimus TaxID=2161824 RepID=A0A369Q6U5_9SPHN|nr:ABC-type transport auxiliary lipoprotein family protein [Alteripontixanthobacter maritimus]RDC59265.1 hypothetical protein HME9302_00452 [Alteripontixanthobacter maritimus]